MVDGPRHAAIRISVIWLVILVIGCAYFFLA
jgi:hypothetical protein